MGKRLATLFLGAVCLFGGCAASEVRMSSYEGYSVKYYILLNAIGHNTNFLWIYSKRPGGGYISFKNNNPDEDSRFDEMELKKVENGDPVEQFASLAIAQKIQDFLEIPSEDSD